MQKVPRLRIELIKEDHVDNLLSPVTPPVSSRAGASSRHSQEGQKRRRIGGLSIEDLINHDTDEKSLLRKQQDSSFHTYEACTPLNSFPTSVEPELRASQPPETHWKRCQRPLQPLKLSSTNSLHDREQAVGAKIVQRDVRVPSSPSGTYLNRKRTRADYDTHSRLPSFQDLIQSLHGIGNGYENDGSRSGLCWRESTDSENVASNQVAPDEVEYEAEMPDKTNMKKQNSKHRRGRPNGDTRPRPFSCVTCHTSFHHKSGLESHVRVVHLKERRYVCPLGCDIRFGARGDVTRHVDAVHLKKRDWICSVCDAAFSRKSILDRHRKNVHRAVDGYTSQQSNDERPR